MTEPASPLSIGTFRPLEGKDFSIDFEGPELVVATLTEVSLLGSPDQPRGFSLLFRVGMEADFPQRIYRLTHATIGTVELFLVPLRPGDDGRLYEAVFT